MNYTSEWIPYERTGSFSPLAVHYLQQHPALRDFYAYPPNWEGLNKALAERKKKPHHREVLVQALKEQYAKIAASEKVMANIERLLLPNCFTVCTAHQPNIFTGYLYFIYKIAHAIQLAEQLQQAHPGDYFVPVYYMGSEDNDLEELNHIFLNGDRLNWVTNQTGAVGNMHTKGLDTLINEVSGRLGIFPHGAELTEALKDAYLKSSTIKEATLRFVHFLFESYGLVVLIPDNAALKNLMVPVFEDDIFNHTPANRVRETATRLAEHYHVQVNPREINLFYMDQGIRERIIQEGEHFIINNTNLQFSAQTLREMLHTQPALFSPNVVLRGMMQETILPNIAFIGGGSEIAYWLELKDMFAYYGIPYPVLLLRNSFLLVNHDMKKMMDKLSLSAIDIFKPGDTLQKELVLRNSSKQLSLQAEQQQLAGVYRQLATAAAAVDPTLAKHVEALLTRTSKGVDNLEKKMLRAEKKRFDVQHRQLDKLKQGLFPANNLQERVENLLPYYAAFGKNFIQQVYRHSPALSQDFGILYET